MLVRAIREQTEKKMKKENRMAEVQCRTADQVVHSESTSTCEVQRMNDE